LKFLKNYYSSKLVNYNSAEYLIIIILCKIICNNEVYEVFNSTTKTVKVSYYDIIKSYLASKC